MPRHMRGAESFLWQLCRTGRGAGRAKSIACVLPYGLNIAYAYFLVSVSIQKLSLHAGCFTGNIFLMPLLHLQKSRCGTGIEGADGLEITSVSVYGKLAVSDCWTRLIPGIQLLTWIFGLKLWIGTKSNKKLITEIEGNRLAVKIKLVKNSLQKH